MYRKRYKKKHNRIFDPTGLVKPKYNSRRGQIIQARPINVDDQPQIVDKKMFLQAANIYTHYPYKVGGQMFGVIIPLLATQRSEIINEQVICNSPGVKALFGKYSQIYPDNTMYVTINVTGIIYHAKSEFIPGLLHITCSLIISDL